MFKDEVPSVSNRIFLIRNPESMRSDKMRHKQKVPSVTRSIAARHSCAWIDRRSGVTDMSGCRYSPVFSASQIYSLLSFLTVINK